MCNICCSDYTSKLRKPVKCNFCQHECCTQCVKSYLLSIVTDPKCMKCDTAWNPEFIDQILSRHFRVGELKKHRQEVLLNREKSQLPDAMPLAEAELQRRKNSQAIDELNKTREKLQSQIAEINTQIYNLKVSGAKTSNNTIKNVFIKACPANNCRGFLDSKLKCSLCDTKVCKDCHEIIDGEDHTCLPENVQTARLINSQCKPCPQCACLIYKLSGCNQIWCTQCKTAFDWATGKIENTNIHNPHYYDWLRTHNAPPATGRDCDRGCMPNNWSIAEHLRKHKINYNQYYDYLRAYNHIQMVELPRYRITNDNSDLRVKFVLNDISEDGFKAELHKREAKNNRVEAFRLLHQMLSDTMRDLIRKIMTLKSQEDFGKLDMEFEELRLYFNEQMEKISKRFNLTRVRQLDTNWYIII